MLRASGCLLACLLLLSTSAGATPHRKPKAPKAPPPAPAAAVKRLGRGWRKFQEGDYAGARRVLARVAIDKLRNRDYALYLLAQSELLTGAPAEARAHFVALEAIPGRFQVIARFRLADGDFEAGRFADALREYQKALPQANDAIAPAVARYRIGAMLEKEGKTAPAIASYRKVYVEYPEHPLAARALERLTALKAPPITAEERIARARVLTNDREWQEALDELALVPSGAPAPVRVEADYWIGTTEFHMRHHYEEAAAKLLGIWDKLPGDERKAEALFHGSRARSRADHDDDAIAGYREVVAKYPHSREAPEASFLIGWLDFNRGRYAQAIPGLTETLRRYGGSRFADDTRWYLGFSRWLSGDVAGALADFQRLATFPGPLKGGKGLYWEGRALDKLGRSGDAVAIWRKLAADFPFTYYAALARVRLREKGIEVGPLDGVGRASVPPLGPVDESLASDPVIARVDELLRAGLDVEAGFELKRGETAFIRRYGAARALPILFDRYARGSNFHRPHALAEAYSGGALKVDPHQDPLARRWWQAVYPLAYRRYVEKYGPTGKNPTYYLYTIMQKESAYDPHDVSYADAIGLLQMIPPTSKRVALRIDYPYTDDVLYDPEGNIRFGAWYIGHLLAKFKEQIPIGAGSYNAGPKAMMKWLTAHGDRPLDEFVELCSYTQTREYMKKVVGIYAHYLWLYAKKDYLPDLKVDARWVDDDHIDY